MKNIIILVFAVLILSSCASSDAYKSYTDAYRSYAEVTKSTPQNKSCEIFTKEQVTLPAGFSLVCYQGNQVANALTPPQQIKDSEWVHPISTAISQAGWFGLGWAVMDGVKTGYHSLENSAGHNSTVNTATSGSYNSNADSHNQTQRGTFNSFNGDNRDNAPVAVVPPVTVVQPIVPTP